MSKNKMAKRVLASSAALCLVLSTTASAATIAPEKLGGANRFDTAIKIAEESWNNAWKGSTNAILASGNQANLVDALAVAPLAYELKAPILLDDANKDVVNADTLQALKDNGVKKVYIATGTGVISEKAEEQLKEAGMEVVRLGGNDRYETAKNILDEFKKNGGSTDTVALVAGTGLADALSVAPIAAKEGMPILLTKGTDKVAAQLEDVAKAAEKVYAVGGSGIISDALVNELNAERLGAANRFDTNAAVVKAFAKDGKVKFDKVYFAEGINGLVDALTGSVLAAQNDAAVILTNNDLDKMADTKEVLKENLTDDTELNAFGKSVVTDSFLEDVAAVNEETEEGEVKVESVTSLNLKQIKVTFSGALDEDEAKKAANYEVEGKEIDNVSVDGNDVIITLADEYDTNDDFKADTFENQKTLKVTIDKDLVDADDDVEKDVEMVDTTLPEVTDIKVVGSDTIKLTFSEPIAPKERSTKEDPDDSSKIVTDKVYADKSAFEVKDEDGDKYFVKEVELLKNNTEANIKLYEDLDGNEVSVKVNGDVKDYAGFGLVTDELRTSFEKDEEKPYVVKAEAESATKVVLTFNEDVRLTDDATEADFYHTNTSNKAKKDGVKVDGNEVTITFEDGNKLPEGTSYVIVKSGALEDLWGNEVDAVKQKIQREEDTTKPEVDKVEQGSNQKTIKVTFSEDVLGDDSNNGAENPDNYTILDEDGEEVDNKIKNVKYTNDDDYVATLTLDENLDAGDYSLVVKNIEDKSENANKLDKVTKDFTVTDKTKPVFTDFKATIYNAGKGNQNIVVDFGEKMTTGDSKYAVDDMDNYQLKLTDGTLIDLDEYEDARIEVINDGKSVEIKVPNDGGDNQEDLTNDTLIIGRVADASGNKTEELNGELTIEESDGVVVKSANATATDKVEITFDGKVDLDTDDIKLQKGDSASAALGNDVVKSLKTTVNSDGNTVLTLNLTDDYALNYNGLYDNDSKLKVVVSAGDSKNEYGDKLKPDTYEVEDKIAPALKANADDDKYDDVVAGFEDGKVVVKLTFEEAINENTVSASTFEVDGYDVEEAKTEGDVITLTLAGYDIPEKDTEINQKAAIKDANGNVVDDIETEVAEVAQGAEEDAAKAAENQAAVNAKLAKVKDGDVTVATDADEDAKLAAVKTYVEGLVDTDKVTVKVEKADDDKTTEVEYKVTLTAGSVSDSKIIKVTFVTE